MFQTENLIVSDTCILLVTTNYLTFLLSNEARKKNKIHFNYMIDMHYSMIVINKDEKLNNTQLLFDRDVFKI